MREFPSTVNAHFVCAVCQQNYIGIPLLFPIGFCQALEEQQRLIAVTGAPSLDLNAQRGEGQIQWIAKGCNGIDKHVLKGESLELFSLCLKDYLLLMGALNSVQLIEGWETLKYCIQSIVKQ